MDNFKNSFAQIKQQTSELKEEIRLERFKKKILPEVQKVYERHDNRKAAWERGHKNVTEIIARELAPKEPETETGQLAALLKRQEIRRGIEALPREKRREICLEKALASRDFYEAIVTAPLEIISPFVVSDIQERMLERRAEGDANFKNILAARENLQNEAWRIDFETKKECEEIRKMLLAEKIDNLNEKPVFESDTAKADFISTKGLEEFKKLFGTGLR